MKKKLANYNHKFNIFGRKKGKKISNKINSEIIKKYLFNFSSDINNNNIILDIGSGNGENTLYLSNKYPDYLIVASEVYEDGIINLCNNLSNRGINNVKIYNSNVLLLIQKIIYKNYIKEIWILFPDPWEKKRHKKRRLINSSFIKKVSFILSKKNRIHIATDSRSYFISILKQFYESGLFRWVNALPSDWDYGVNTNFKTRYFEKALISNKKSFFLIFEKI